MNLIAQVIVRSTFVLVAIGVLVSLTIIAHSIARAIVRYVERR